MTRRYRYRRGRGIFIFVLHVHIAVQYLSLAHSQIRKVIVPNKPMGDEAQENDNEENLHLRMFGGIRRIKSQKCEKSSKMSKTSGTEDGYFQRGPIPSPSCEFFRSRRNQ